MRRFDWTANETEDFFYESMLRTPKTIRKIGFAQFVVSPDALRFSSFEDASRWVEETETMAVNDFLGLGYEGSDESDAKIFDLQAS